jgi:mannose-6-phosphate isomerase
MTRAQRLTPILQPRIWGSTHLSPWYPDPSEKVGEVWFTGEPQPPVLVKFLFTTDKLSVQVHPGGPNGKTEMWHVLRADPGAVVAAGFQEPVSASRLREASLSGEVEHLLRWLPVQAGDTIFVPAGTVHAIGAGLAICEIQQYSDVTYRLFDYSRGRELHLEEGLRVANLGTHPGLVRAAGEHLVRCEYFDTSRIEVDGERDISADLITILEGEGEAGDQACSAGETWRLFDTLRVKGHLKALITSVP